MKIRVKKKWSGDDHGDATVQFAVNGAGSYSPNTSGSTSRNTPARK